MISSTFWVHVSEPTLYSGSRFARPPLDPFPPQATLLVTLPLSQPSRLVTFPVATWPYCFACICHQRRHYFSGRCQNVAVHVFIFTCTCKKKVVIFYNISTIFPQYFHNIFTIFSQYFHNISTIFYIFCIFTIFWQYFHNILTICSGWPVKMLVPVSLFLHVSAKSGGARHYFYTCLQTRRRWSDVASWPRCKGRVTWVGCGRDRRWMGWVGKDVVAGTHRCRTGQRLQRFCGSVCSLAGVAENNDF